MNNHFLYGDDFNLNQYELRRGGETYVKSDGMIDYFSYSTPMLLNDDDILNEGDKLLILNAK